jgi:pyridoxine 4-dehydrogenase
LLIPGTSSMGHLEQNVAAAGITLDEDTQAELVAATQ